MVKNIDEYTLKKQSIGKIDTYVIALEYYNEFLDALNNDGVCSVSTVEI